MLTAYIRHPDCLKPDPGEMHPEQPARLRAIDDQLLASGLLSYLDCHDAPQATLEQIERSLLRQALDRAGGVRTRAAQYLGLSFRSFRYRLQKIGMGGAELGDEDDAPAAPRAR